MSDQSSGDPIVDAVREKFNSPMFGETRHATDDERAVIRGCVEQTPVTVFQELNKALNNRGFAIMIISKEEQN